MRFGTGREHQPLGLLTPHRQLDLRASCWASRLRHHSLADTIIGAHRLSRNWFKMQIEVQPHTRSQVLDMLAWAEHLLLAEWGTTSSLAFVIQIDTRLSGV